jgi:hypothetical protein
VPRFAWRDDPPGTASLQKLMATIFNHPDHPKFLNPGARNGSPSVMADLVCFCLAAAPGYISSRSFHPPSTSSNHRISLGHSFPILFSLHLLSLRGFEFSTSPVALAAIPSSAKALEVRCLSNVLHISTTPVQLGSLISFSFTYFLLTLDSSGVLPTFAIDYDPLLFEALYTSILHTAVDSAHDSAHDRRFFTHPVDP